MPRGTDDDAGELYSTSQVARATGTSEAVARAWAADNAVRRFGNLYVWTVADAAAFREDVAIDAGESDDDEDEAAEDDEEE